MLRVLVWPSDCSSTLRLAADETGSLDFTLEDSSVKSYAIFTFSFTTFLTVNSENVKSIKVRIYVFHEILSIRDFRMVIMITAIMVMVIIVAIA